MAQGKRIFLILPAFFLVLAVDLYTAFAATVILKSGEKVEGEILERTGEYIKLKLDGMPRTFWLEGVEQIDGEPLSQEAPAAKVGEYKSETEKYRNEAGQYFINERYEDALSSLEKIIALDPSNFDVYIKAGIIYCYLRRFNEAITAFKKALSLKPDNSKIADIYLCLGVAYDTMGRAKDAKDNLLKAATHYQKEGDGFKILIVDTLLNMVQKK